MSSDRHQWFLDQFFRHRAAVRRYLQRMVSSSEDIDDLIQETYLRIYGVRDHEQVESPQALLISIAHNLAVERLRRRVRQATDSVADFEALDVLARDPPADEQLDSDRRFEIFCAAVDTLPAVCRRVFVLRKVYKLSHDEIADVLGISHSTIEKHVVKGLKRCRDHLRERGMLPGESEQSLVRGRPAERQGESS